LYEDGRFPTASGRARFAAVKHRATAEKTDARYPLALNTGRLRDQWHGMSRTGTVARLSNHAGDPRLEMHARDMQSRRLVDGDIARLSCRRGELLVRVEASAQMRSGQVFLPMHWGSQFMRGAGANALTVSAFDPLSKQPELKHAAIEVAAVDLPYRVVAMRRFDATAADAVQTLREALQPLLQAFDYATLTLNGRDNAVVILRGYAATPINDSVLDTLDQLFDLADASRTMRYVDARRRVEKAALVETGIVQSVCLSGETAAHEWLKNMMVEGAPAEAMRPWILAPVAAPPRGSFNRGKIVCNCLDVSEAEIRIALAAGAGLPQLQERLKCGTECGSCMPELKRLCNRQEAGSGMAHSIADSAAPGAESGLALAPV
jgi:assimilatory nitrate reductase catalytic subunit